MGSAPGLGRLDSIKESRASVDETQGTQRSDSVIGHASAGGGGLITGSTYRGANRTSLCGFS